MKKLRFGHGQDATQMLARQLLTNFFKNGTLTTTKDRAKKLRPFIEKMASKIKKPTQSSKNYLLKYLNDLKLIGRLYKEVAPTIKDRPGGYVRIVRLGKRLSDGVLKVRIEWTTPVVKEELAKVEKTAK